MLSSTSVVVVYLVVAVLATSHAHLGHRRKQAGQRGKPQDGSIGALRERIQQLRHKQEMLELQEEREQALQEEMEDLVGKYELEDLALQLGTETLGRILRPLREHPTEAPIDDCVTRNWNVQLEFGLAGTVAYTVCGSGDDASLQMRFLMPGQTTEAETSTATPTTPRPRLLCPTRPATPPPQPADTTTTTAAAATATSPSPDTSTSSQVLVNQTEAAV